MGFFPSTGGLKYLNLICLQPYLLAALEEIKKESTIMAAAKKYNIPRSSLSDKYNGRRTRQEYLVDQQRITPVVEDRLNSWIHTQAKGGLLPPTSRSRNMLPNLLPNQRELSWEKGG